MTRYIIDGKISLKVANKNIKIRDLIESTLKPHHYKKLKFKIDINDVHNFANIIPKDDFEWNDDDFDDLENFTEHLSLKGVIFNGKMTYSGDCEGLINVTDNVYSDGTTTLTLAIHDFVEVDGIRWEIITKKEESNLNGQMVHDSWILRRRA